MLAIEEGRRAIVEDPEVPEFATRVLMGIEPAGESTEPGFWLRRSFDHFKKDVGEILESACSLREHDPEADIFKRLSPKIQYLDHGSAHNLSISVAGVLLAEQVLDRHAQGWRVDRSTRVLTRLAYNQRMECAGLLREPRHGRDSPIDLRAKELVGLMLRHLIRCAGAQELLGEAGNLQMTTPAVIAPIKLAWQPPLDPC
jgi:hypothetical protein